MNPGQLSIAQGNLRRAGSGRPLSDVSAAVGTGMTSNLAPMSRPVPRTIFTSYAVAWLYLAGFIAAQVAYAALSPHDQAAVLRWASTNVHNLRHHPVGSLVTSAFVTQTFATAWPALIALAMFGANRVLGNWRTALVCAAGQVAGTLVAAWAEIGRERRANASRPPFSGGLHGKGARRPSRPVTALAWSRLRS